MTASRLQPLRVHALEDRTTPTINFLFDFRFDGIGFFTNHPERIATLVAAAEDVGSRFSDNLSAIPFPTSLGDFWKAKFDRPGGVGQPEEITNLPVPANTVIVFVGARELLGEKTLESSSREVFGTAAWNELVLGRGQPDSFGPAATDFSPWGGSITFDSIANWHFGIDPPGNSNEFDFYTAVQKSLFHLLGFGMSESWNRLGGTGQFFGPEAVAVFGAPVPLTSGNFEWVEDTLSQGQRTLMDADLEDGERIGPTALDLAAMSDIGWEVAATPSPPPPPAAPRPPVVPPAPIPAGTELIAVGTGPGLDSRFTVNAASPFTQLAEYNPFAAFSPSETSTGGSRAVTADLNNDGVQDVIVGPGPGIPTQVFAFDGKSFPVSPGTSLLASGYAFEPSFTGGVFLSAGDVNGDGFADVVVSPDEGGGPRVKIVSGRDRTILADFFGIDDPNFRGGARTSLGDFNGDGTLDLVVAAGFGGGPRVAVFDGTSIVSGGPPRKLFNDIFVFEQGLRNGAFVAAGDVDGDGKADLGAGGGPGGAPRVLILSGADLVAGNSSSPRILGDFFAGNIESRGGIRLAIKNLDNDNKADLVAGAGEGAQGVVTTYLGFTIAPGAAPPKFQEYLIFDPSFTGGVYVG